MQHRYDCSDETKCVEEQEYALIGGDSDPLIPLGWSGRDSRTMSISIGLVAVAVVGVILTLTTTTTKRRRRRGRK